MKVQSRSEAVMSAKEWIWETEEVEIQHKPAIIDLVEIPETDEMEWWK